MITLIDFYADWCGPCVAMKPVMEKVMKDYEGKVKFENVNVDEDQTKAMKYGVMSIPTLVIEKEGSEVSRKLGMQPEPVLRQWLDSFVEAK